MSYDQIPLELQNLRQWINWREETINGKPTKIPLNPANGEKASVSDPLNWSSFGNVLQCAAFCNGIGFVFTASDPFVGIDLDAAHGDNEIQNRQNEVYYDLASYSELSPSGQGLHIICKGKLPGPGRRRNKIECYDTGRFFTFTGNRVNDWQVEYRQLAIETLYETLGKPQHEQSETAWINEPATADDAMVIERCRSASNGEKFARLFAGDWQTDYGHQSQSEADFALFNIIAFYTRNREQIVRIFRSSGLGQRDKAKRNAYMVYMLNKTFDRMPPKADMDSLYNQRLEILSRLNRV